MSHQVDVNAEGNLLLHPGEQLLFPVGRCLFSLEVDGHKKLSSVRGAAFITSERLIFLGEKTKNPEQRVCFPITLVTNTKYEQPVFSPNHFNGECPVLPGGGIAGGACRFKITFHEAGGDGFVTTWAQLASRIHLQRVPVAPPPYAQAASQGTPLDPAAAAQAQNAPMYYSAAYPNMAFAAAAPGGPKDEPPAYETFNKKKQ